MFDIKENLKKLPDSPGVYIHKDKLGQVIYVGKAISLRNRVRQYFQSSKNMDPKVRSMASQIAEFEYINCGSEMEAFILECNLIKRYRPKYNILLRDDKTYPYIKVTLSEEWPRVVKTREVRKGSDRYFGPYSDVGSVNMMVDLLNDVYRLKRCSRQRFHKGHRPCLNLHIGSCDGICTGGADHDAYMERIGLAMDYLKGRGRDIERYLEENMKKASDSMDYERAARFRDYLLAARSLHEKQRVVLSGAADADAVVSIGGQRAAVFFIRDGKLQGRETYQLGMEAGGDKSGEERKELIKEFIRQHYAGMTDGPAEILLEEEIPEMEMVEGYLSGLWPRKVKIHVPKRGEKKAVLDLAVKDARDMEKTIEDREKSKEERTRNLAKEIGDVLSLAGYGRRPEGEEYRVEAYDISNTNGLDSVGGMVVFNGLTKDRKAYRRFKIRTIDGQDDYGSMQEVLYRRFRRAQAGDPGFSVLPDILLMDGGRGHVSAAREMTDAMGIDIPIIGMVKDDDHRTRALVYIEGNGFGEIPLKDKPLLFKYVGTVQEEVHRFAIEYHRSLRDKGKLSSVLDEIEGIGPVKRNALLAHFGSIENIRRAGREELAETPGITEKNAGDIYKYFH